MVVFVPYYLEYLIVQKPPFWANFQRGTTLLFLQNLPFFRDHDFFKFLNFEIERLASLFANFASTRKRTLLVIPSCRDFATLSLVDFMHPCWRLVH